MKRLTNLITGRTLLIVILGLLIVFPFGCSKKEPQDKFINLGASFPLSGDNASYGNDARQGIELALDEINASGGIKGKKVVVAFEDDVVDPQKGVNIMLKFATVEKVPVVIGSAGTGVTLAMAPIANKKKVVLISPISSGAAVTEAGPFVFRTCPSDSAQAEIVADWMLEKNLKNVGVLYVNNAWGVGLQKAFKKYFEAKGGKVLIEEGTEEIVTDYRSQLTKLVSVKCDALYIPTYSKQGGRILRQAKELGISIPIFGGDTWGAQELLDAAGSAADGAFFVVPEKYEGKGYQDFTKKYEAKYHTVPNFNASSSYDCMHIVAIAISKVAEAGLPITGDNVRKSLQESSFVGATGLTKFDQNGDVVGKVFGRREIRNGMAKPIQ
jgi:branched-chain amino acid transport system substrate-binding protein